MVSAPARRHNSICRESSQEISGHLSFRLRKRRLAGDVARTEDVFLFWIEQGVEIFRVDNPHTKAFPFWEW